MSEFEFISVFISIVLALGVSDILNSWGEQIRLRDVVKHYWLHTAWGILLMLATIHAWWGMWRLRERDEWSFLDNLILIVPYLLLALIAYVLTPSISNGHADIKRYYYRNSPWIFSLAAAFIASLVVNTRVVLGTPILDPINVVRGISILIMISLAVTKKEWFHITAVTAAGVLLMIYISLVQVSL